VHIKGNDGENIQKPIPFIEGSYIFQTFDEKPARGGKKKRRNTKTSQSLCTTAKVTFLASGEKSDRGRMEKRAGPRKDAI